MPQFRVLIVDDSAFMRAVIKDLIEEDSAFEIAGMARTGREAVEAAARLKPDVMTLDLEMPEMNGLEALGLIMAARPLPVIMFSGISEEHTAQTIAALQQGAFDFIRKPSASSPPGEIGMIGKLLREKLHTAVLIRDRLQRLHSVGAIQPSATEDQQVKNPLQSASLFNPREADGEAKIRRPLRKEGDKQVAEKSSANSVEASQSSSEKTAGRRQGAPAKGIRQPVDPLQSGIGAAKLEIAAKSADQAPSKQQRSGSGSLRPNQVADATPAVPALSKPSTAFTHLIAVGTSTGGPRALHELLAGMPADLPAPVLIVQHMPPRFTASLAKRLDSSGPLRVFEAEDGQRVQSGEAYLAPGGNHMELSRDERGYFIRLTQSDPVSGHRPSVDVLFRSLVPFTELKRHAVILTGMGSDGSKGMLELRDSGAASTIAEAEETSIVYGMPRSAVENGSCRTVLPLPMIAKELASRC
ncbi:protein-glutamate methylesterase/protein-glutamine glutaminase [Paenibacillus herberti]|uniref:Protein-glutamate methylesterase/protein-glutamine glutaminase n=1 Tax=Paenibacillus herberti TaxID=1619309 RepID=A0A229P189_9BACL|nr:chemotaxis response regulator protein-glutamate methylesterase [Paenibacillus herberti]OXM16003.1 chemotaxis response regulator protein-glutamate methylesterase [Paenibacillus herberti]